MREKRRIRPHPARCLFDPTLVSRMLRHAPSPPPLPFRRFAAWKLNLPDPRESMPGIVLTENFGTLIAKFPSNVAQGALRRWLRQAERGSDILHL